MKITVNKKNKTTTSVDLNLSVREFEIFEAWVGAVPTYEIVSQINAYLPFSRKTNSEEINNFIGSDGWKKLNQVLKEDVLPVIIKEVSFVYDKCDGSTPTWRNVSVTNENNDFISGFDNDDNNAFKKFLKCRILGGRIIEK